MAWTNIFDLGAWDVYVQFNSIASASPNSNAYLVPIAELAPEIGQVTIEGGEIVCDFIDRSGSGGVEIMVVAMPSGTPPQAAPFRVSVVKNGSPMIAGSGSDAAYVFSTGPLVEAGLNEYEPSSGAVFDTIPDGIDISEVQASASLPSGEGIGFEKDYTGL